MKTLAQELAEEAERLTKAYLWHTRPRRPLSISEAQEEHRLVEEAGKISRRETKT